MKDGHAIKTGLCGFTLAMDEYARHFSVVEVQQTFYEPPADFVMRRWLTLLPPPFEFTLKAWQLITHDGKSPTYRRLRRVLTPVERATCGGFRDSAIVREALARTLACQRLLSATAVLFQCPASFRPEPENITRLRTFFARIANPVRPIGVRYLWEPRGPAWTKHAALARELCAELDLMHVVDPFVTAPSPADGDRGGMYFRLHGIKGARHVYTDAELRALVRMTPPHAHVMFNNIPRVRDAARFVALLDDKHRDRDE